MPIRTCTSHTATPQCHLNGAPVRLETATQAWLRANEGCLDDARDVFCAALHPQGEAFRDQLLDAGIEITFPEHQH